MTKPYIKYNVFFVQDGCGVYASYKTFVGETYAKSKAQACNNVRFRREGRCYGSYQNSDSLGMGNFKQYYLAEEA